MLAFKNCVVLCPLAGLDDCFKNYYLPNWDTRLSILTSVYLYTTLGKLQFIIIIFFHVTLKGLSIWTPKTINFPFFPSGKLMVLCVLICKHIRAEN